MDRVACSHVGWSKITAFLTQTLLGSAPAHARLPAFRRASVVLDQSLSAAGVDHLIELYPGAQHGFAVPDFSIYDHAAAERHWERVLALCVDTLGRTRATESGDIA